MGLLAADASVSGNHSAVKQISASLSRASRLDDCSVRQFVADCASMHCRSFSLPSHRGDPGSGVSLHPPCLHDPSLSLVLAVKTGGCLYLAAWLRHVDVKAAAGSRSDVIRGINHVLIWHI